MRYRKNHIDISGDHRLAGLLAVCVLCLSLAHVQHLEPTEKVAQDAVPASVRGQQPDIMLVEDVQPGMKGFGLTVFDGRTLESFDVQILGVTRSMSPGSGIVLAQLEAPDLEESGLIAGMSGSPVYVRPAEGEPPQLLGAIAYGFPFARSAIAGITPAEDMEKVITSDSSVEGQELRETDERTGVFRKNIEIQKQTAQKLAKDELTPQEAERRILAARLRLFGFNPSRGAEVPVDGQLPGISDRKDMKSMTYLPVPMAVGELREGQFEDFASLVRMAGFLPVQSVSGEDETGGEETAIAPGTPIGGVYVTGDLELAGMGTVTFVDEDRVVAFGHPMANTGTSKLPLATGRVQAVIPSYQRSFRLASIDRFVGTMTQDRQSGIGGVLGKKAPMFPCTLRVDGAREASYNYRVAGYWQVAPMASFYAAMSGALHWEGQGTGVTIEGKSTIQLKDGEEPIVIQNTYAGFDPVEPISDMVLRPLSLLMPNPFEEVEIEKLDIDLRIKPDIRAASIESVSLEESKVEPGQKLRLRVKLKQYQGKTFWKDMSVKIPDNAQPDTSVGIVVSGAKTYRNLQSQMDPGFFAPDEFEDLVESIQWSPSNTKIFVRAGFVRRGVRYDGAAMPDLPSSARVMMETGGSYGRTEPLVEDQSSSLDCGFVVDGMVRADVNIKSGTDVGRTP